METPPRTRTSTIGPIANSLEASGGSVARAFRTVQLPLALIDGETAAIVFRAKLLELPNSFLTHPEGPSDIVSEAPGFTGVVGQMIRLELLSGQTGIDKVATRLGLTRRTMQRRLAANGLTFERLAQTIILSEAKARLRDTDNRITDIALELGYSDPAHFTRAYRRWTGCAPHAWRMSLRSRR
ncbi:MAG: AraC family transcriptional regulator [Acidiphilium sp.]|nr:AraC family transcriptional regulator [Acidiphilium sp.]MDD4935633.1 AraC family transcriptional regulator [Acidiphilium sp.]